MVIRTSILLYMMDHLRNESFTQKAASTGDFDTHLKPAALAMASLTKYDTSSTLGSSALRPGKPRVKVTFELGMKVARLAVLMALADSTVVPAGGVPTTSAGRAPAVVVLLQAT